MLGSNSVTLVTFADHGRTVALRWESATFAPGIKRADMRELLSGEAILTTANVMAGMREIVRVRFTIVRGGRILAVGVNHRGRGMTMAYAAELGGGAYVPPVRAEGEPAAPGTGSSAQLR